ncbi:hypothetical protein ACFVYT_24810 [Streptomyces sp. NPDC058290]|uniref:hypothetical protein n=1 Tax=Streptomyces sp. NPDC058290 TaxID=3346426 RepID=UPI0036E376E5
MTINPDSPDRYDRILHAIGSALDSLDAWPNDSRALETIADAVEKLIDTELEASQRRAIRIQTLLDETRDRARKDAIAGRESERILQQQIDAQAREIDRLQAAERRLLAGAVPDAKCRRCHCPSGGPQCEHCNCCDVPDQRTV